MDLIFTKAYQLRSSDFDRYGRLLPASVLDIFQEVAIEQSNADNNSHEAMLSKGGFWVVVRIKYQVIQDSFNEEVVYASTWPHSPSKSFIMRDFKIENAQGETLIVGSSEWMVLSSKTRSIAPIADFYDVDREFPTARSFDTKIKKVKDFDIAGATHSQIQPSYTDLDLNGHINNAKYANYVVNAMHPTEAGKLKSFQIEFLHEVLLGEPIDMYAVQEEDYILVKGQHQDGQTMFVSRVDVSL